jgi:hypothetical protein
VLRTAIPIDPVGTTTLKSWIVADNIGKTTVLYIPSSVDSSTLVVLLNVDPKNADLLTIGRGIHRSGFHQLVEFPETATTTTSTAPNTSDVVITTNLPRPEYRLLHHGRNIFHGNRRADGGWRICCAYERTSSRR